MFYFSHSSSTGHYTQLIWAKTYAIGCGYTQYRDGRFNKGLYVCNYGPAGNYINENIYLIGQPCSQCPPTTKCSTTYQGLCSALDANQTGFTNIVADNINYNTIQRILKYHNEIRQRLASGHQEDFPKAANMRQMVGYDKYTC